MTPYIQILVTVPDRDLAERLADLLLDLKLVACVQMIPCHSRYRWKRKIEQAEEILCIMKSRQDLFPELCWRIRQEHPYNTPEIVSTPIMAGSEGYLDWLAIELRPVAREELF